MNIIIIGAGAAGLMAARTLSAKGIKVLVLEARNRLGGRIHTIEDTFTRNAEAGAEFIHGDLKLTRKLLKQAGIRRIKVKGGIFSIENGHTKEENDFVEGWGALLRQLKKVKTDITIKTFLHKYLPGEEYSDIKDSFKKYVQGYNAADIDNASTISIREEMENEDSEQFRIENGYMGLIRFLAEESEKNGCLIRTSAIVKQINWQKDNVEIITDNDTYNAQKAIITVPIGVLQANKNDRGSIAFYPEIKAQQRAIHQIGFGWVIKILLEFDEAFWFNKQFLERMHIDEPFFIFSDTFIPTWWTQFPDKSPLLAGWLAGPDANRHSHLPENAMLEKAIDSLAEIFSITSIDLMKKLKAYQVHNWVNDPFCRGAYSYSTPATKNAVDLFKEPVQDTLYFAGEGLSKEGTGTVDAALQSGEEVAKKILAQLS